MQNSIGFGSLCVHELEDKKTTRPHQLPIYATSSFEFENLDQGVRIFSGQEAGHLYGRFGNPTVDAVADKIARLETHGLGMEASALLFSSGMAAITTLFLATLRPGDRILTQGNLYGGTTDLLRKLIQPLGIEPVFGNLQDYQWVEDQLRRDPAIRMIYFETPANPTLACVDMEVLAGLARHYERLSVADNTFATPFLQQPLASGVDFIIHSTTKYLNGHGNSISGALVGRDAAFVHEKAWQTMKLAGTNCNPWDAWLINNGLKTLELRMERHCSNAAVLAAWLEEHPKVSQVSYPGLPTHPDHELARRQMRRFGGMLSFELKGGLEAGIAFMNRIRFCTLAPTMGDVDTLIMHPASMSHLNVPRELRLENGITDGLIRLSVGIETVEDIRADLEQALEH